MTFLAIPIILVLLLVPRKELPLSTDCKGKTTAFLLILSWEKFRPQGFDITKD